MIRRWLRRYVQFLRAHPWTWAGMLLAAILLLLLMVALMSRSFMLPMMYRIGGAGGEGGGADQLAALYSTTRAKVLDSA